MNLILLARYWKYIVIGVLAMLLVPVMLLPACQAQSTRLAQTQPPMPTLESSIPEQPETYSKSAAENISAWQKRLIELQTTYEQSSKVESD